MRQSQLLRIALLPYLLVSNLLAVHSFTFFFVAFNDGKLVIALLRLPYIPWFSIDVYGSSSLLREKQLMSIRRCSNCMGPFSGPCSDEVFVLLPFQNSLHCQTSRPPM
ncbi:hypothetical protein M758_UG012000 [Ceratodon purpureus]|nr:hypothetical protein M758_UG012000 [Ceratodon purpureus]